MSRNHKDVKRDALLEMKRRAQNQLDIAYDKGYEKGLKDGEDIEQKNADATKADIVARYTTQIEQLKKERDAAYQKGYDAAMHNRRAMSMSEYSQYAKGAEDLRLAILKIYNGPFKFQMYGQRSVYGILKVSKALDIINALCEKDPLMEDEE